MALYAAYGSNLDPAQMLLRCPHSPQRGTGWLEGWRLTFGGEDIGWDGALATVVEDPGSRVFVVLYDVSEGDTVPVVERLLVALGYVVEHHEDPGAWTLDHGREGTVPADVLPAERQPPSFQPAGSPLG